MQNMPVLCGEKSSDAFSIELKAAERARETSPQEMNDNYCKS
jgi:hypothetical protein